MLCQTVNIFLIQGTKYYHNAVITSIHAIALGICILLLKGRAHIVGSPYWCVWYPWIWLNVGAKPASGGFQGPFGCNQYSGVIGQYLDNTVGLWYPQGSCFGTPQIEILWIIKSARRGDMLAEVHLQIVWEPHQNSWTTDHCWTEETKHVIACVPPFCSGRIRTDSILLDLNLWNIMHIYPNAFIPPSCITVRDLHSGHNGLITSLPLTQVRCGSEVPPYQLTRALEQLQKWGLAWCGDMGGCRGGLVQGVASLDLASGQGLSWVYSWSQVVFWRSLQPLSIQHSETFRHFAVFLKSLLDSSGFFFCT